MATKQLYATGTFKYQNRRLKAGDPVEMDGPNARLYAHLKLVTDKRPRRSAPPAAAEPAPVAETTPEPAPAPQPKARRVRKKK
jgi:hypothetical protein